MAYWRTVRSGSNCYKQQMERGYVNGVWTTYAVSGYYPCDGEVSYVNPDDGLGGAYVPPEPVKEVLNTKKGAFVLDNTMSIAPKKRRDN